MSASWPATWKSAGRSCTRTKLQEAGLVTSSLRFSGDGKSLRHFELQPSDIRLTPEIIADSIDHLIAQPLPREGTG